MGLQDIYKVLVSMLLVVRVFCCPQAQYRNWQSLMCSKMVVVVWMYTWGDDPINIHERTVIYSSAYA